MSATIEYLRDRVLEADKKLNGFLGDPTRKEEIHNLLSEVHDGLLGDDISERLEEVEENLEKGLEIAGKLSEIDPDLRRPVTGPIADLVLSVLPSDIGARASLAEKIKLEEFLAAFILHIRGVSV